MTATYVDTLHGRRRARSWVEDKIFMGQTGSDYLRSLATPFNAVAGAILLVGLLVAGQRFTLGLGATTNLTNTYPWGLWIGFDVLCGVALAAGGYTLATTVHVFRLRAYYPLVRPAILTGLLGYFFVVVGLLLDLGRPWRLPYPIFFSLGMTSVMFSVAWHLFLYLVFLCIEFLPTVFEWLGWRGAREQLVRATLWVTIMGVMLSTLHQAALGGLFLLAPGKLHPLWYSPLLPLFFFVSSAFAGLSMVIVECTLSHRFLKNLCPVGRREQMDRLVIGLARAAALIMFSYLGLKFMGVAAENSWRYLATPLGIWFLVETLGFVLLPCILFLYGARQRSANLARAAAVLAVIGIVVNRINVTAVAFNWQLADRYVPRWSEFAVTLAIITLGVLAFRWIVNRMPVLHEHPEFGPEQ